MNIKLYFRKHRIGLIILGLLIIILVKAIYQTDQWEKEAAGLLPLPPLPSGTLEEQMKFAINDVGTRFPNKSNTAAKIERVAEFGEPALPLLIQKMEKEGYRHNLMLCVGAIARKGSSKAFEYLFNLLKDKRSSLDTKERSLNGIKWIRDKKIFVPLLAIMSDEETEEDLRDSISDTLAILIKADPMEDLSLKYEYYDPEYRQERPKRWKQFISENLSFLYWSTEMGNFVVVIDEEAKAAGIPTEEYRKTHPWPAEQTPAKTDEQNNK